MPKQSSEIDFELSSSRNPEDVNKLDYFVRVIYNGESLGVCTDGKEEYKKPFKERIFKIYCPLEEF